MPLPNPPVAEGIVGGAEAFAGVFALSGAEAIGEGADVWGGAAGLKVIV